MSRRLSLTLEPLDEAAFAPLAQEGPSRDALLRLAAEHNLPDTDISSDAALLRTLIRVGAAAVRDQVLEQGYAEIADDYRQADDDREVLRKRRIARDATRG